MLNDSSQAYGIVSKIFHWLVAILIFGLFAIGVWMVELGYYDQWYKDAPFYHKSTGIILAFIMLLRIFWRTINSKPAPLASHRLWEQRLALATHILIYTLILLIITSGYLISTADGRGISVFNLFEIPSAGLLVENQEDRAGLVHQWMAYILMGLIVLHIGAALTHHFIHKDQTLKRML
ncbi:cytochrome b [Aliikangiella maris]|uniref:Cytochrome b n=2 Tax=Aliikangiella maris TaxID=3162458 RepID=A0ABV3MQA9_9GAMM